MPLHLWPVVLGPLDGVLTLESAFRSCDIMSIMSSFHSFVSLYCINKVSIFSINMLLLGHCS